MNTQSLILAANKVWINLDAYQTHANNGNRKQAQVALTEAFEAGCRIASELGEVISLSDPRKQLKSGVHFQKFKELIVNRQGSYFEEFIDAEKALMEAMGDKVLATYIGDRLSEYARQVEEEGAFLPHDQAEIARCITGIRLAVCSRWRDLLEETEDQETLSTIAAGLGQAVFGSFVYIVNCSAEAAAFNVSELSKGYGFCKAMDGAAKLLGVFTALVQHRSETTVRRWYVG